MAQSANKLPAWFDKSIYIESHNPNYWRFMIQLRLNLLNNLREKSTPSHPFRKADSTSKRITFKEPPPANRFKEIIRQTEMQARNHDSFEARFRRETKIGRTLTAAYPMLLNCIQN